MDDSRKHKLDELLSFADRLGERDRARKRDIEFRRDLQAFEELARAELTPTLRQFMHRLERSGHESRLRKVRPGKLSFELTLHAGGRRAGQVDIELLDAEAAAKARSKVPKAVLRLTALRELRTILTEDAPLRQMNGDQLADFLLRALEHLLR